MRPSVLVLGPPAPAGQLTAALGALGLAARALTPDRALRSAGSLLGVDLAVLAAPPARHPMLEAEAHAAAVGVLHVWWDGGQAEVGPFTRHGFGPCPACLAGSTTPAGSGGSAGLAAWACALTALEAAAFLRLGTTELIGASWRWRLQAPGLALALWPTRRNCPTPGCRQP